MATAAAEEVTSSLLHLRLAGVSGDGQRASDVLVHGTVQDCSQHIIYFGGDVQDYPENMLRHRDNKRFIAWNLEYTAATLHKKFQSSLVFVIKPSKMHLLTFAVYSDFLTTTDFGGPLHSSDHGAIQHLSCMYKSLLRQLADKTDQASSPPRSIKLIGFSKGCTVLNQLTFELHLVDQNPELRDFISQITEIYWLDGGHSGGKDNTWVTEDKALRKLASLDLSIFVHVTPYQIRDPCRKWIGQQEASFVKKLKSFGARIEEKEHFVDEPPCIENHFKVLEIF